jgi:hypothetical protein
MSKFLCSRSEINCACQDTLGAQTKMQGKGKGVEEGIREKMKKKETVVSRESKGGTGHQYSES